MNCGSIPTSLTNTFENNRYSKVLFVDDMGVKFAIDIHTLDG